MHRLSWRLILRLPLLSAAGGCVQGGFGDGQAHLHPGLYRHQPPDQPKMLCPQRLCLLSECCSLPSDDVTLREEMQCL